MAANSRSLNLCPQCQRLDATEGHGLATDSDQRLQTNHLIDRQIPDRLPEHPIKVRLQKPRMRVVVQDRQVRSARHEIGRAPDRFFVPLKLYGPKVHLPVTSGLGDWDIALFEHGHFPKAELRS